MTKANLVLLFCLVGISGAASAQILEGSIVDGCTSAYQAIGSVTFTKTASNLPVVIVQGVAYPLKSFDATEVKGISPVELIDATRNQPIVINCPKADVDSAIGRMLMRRTMQTPEI